MDSFSFYVKIDGKVNRAALERYRQEIEQFVRDIKDKYVQAVVTVLGYYNTLNPYNQLALDQEKMRIVDVQ